MNLDSHKWRYSRITKKIMITRTGSNVVLKRTPPIIYILQLRYAGRSVYAPRLLHHVAREWASGELVDETRDCNDPRIYGTLPLQMPNPGFAMNRDMESKHL